MNYIAEMQHSEETIRRLVQVQYNTFGWKMKVLLIGIAAVMIGMGALGGFSSGVSTILLLLGCWVGVSIQMPARRNAEDVLRRVNGSFPHADFRFLQKEIQVTIQTGDQKVENAAEYSGIFRLLEDGQYFYLFMNSASAYMVSKSTVKPDNLTEFREFMQKKTGLSFEKPGSFLNLNLRSILLRVQNSRKRKSSKK